MRWAGPTLRLTANEVADWIDHQVDAAPANQRGGLRAALESSPVPDRMPSFGRLLVSGAGHLWVAAYSPPDVDAARWEVFDSDGRWLGAVVNPERLRILDAGPDWVLVVSADALGEERLELRRLRLGS
jgi:hypothetical protein